MNDYDAILENANYYIIKETKDNISRMPQRMEKGLNLIYPERQYEYLHFLLNQAYSDNGDYIDTALQIMQSLEDGMSVENASKWLKDPVGIHAAKIRKVVLSYSKRGPEFFKNSLSFPYENLDQETKQAVAMIEQENMRYAEISKSNQNCQRHLK